ncbi:hypothetical protein DPX16_16868 [Anabarilius grahami]|uniref:Uncharacterized protein n=1 Tax=Anabarilius grahami TaxID=495550 RepID=A0A3N0YSS6_ANAGA|nr:hypothetical protein DPX16_16868 [Anabarilius grahami]
MGERSTELEADAPSWLEGVCRTLLDGRLAALLSGASGRVSPVCVLRIGARVRWSWGRFFHTERYCITAKFVIQGKELHFVGLGRFME